MRRQQSSAHRAALRAVRKGRTGPPFFAIQGTFTGSGELRVFGFVLPFVTGLEENPRVSLDSEDMTRGESYLMGRRRSKGPFIVVAELGT